MHFVRPRYNSEFSNEIRYSDAWVIYIYVIYMHVEQECDSCEVKMHVRISVLKTLEYPTDR